MTSHATCKACKGRMRCVGTISWLCVVCLDALCHDCIGHATRCGCGTFFRNPYIV